MIQKHNIIIETMRVKMIHMKRMAVKTIKEITTMNKFFRKMMMLN